VSVEVEYASEFRYRNPILHPTDDVFIVMSQSGETADTLAALKLVKQIGGSTLGITNNAHSSMMKLVDNAMLLDAGTEISVAATKTFLLQIVSFIVLMRQFIPDLDKLSTSIPGMIKKSLMMNSKIQDIVQNAILKASNVILVGRGISYPIALEGALKIKELSYIPAEGIAAGELKHGSIALIDSSTPVIVMIPEDRYYSKMISSLHEIHARSAKIILIAGQKAIKEVGNLCEYIIEVPDIEFEAQIPFVYTPILQLLAYHTSLLKGHNVDKPRNLAKSVTVE
jgi:glucosamine--fructose-6-phosphate aminotransferase (isomerizing)